MQTKVSKRKESSSATAKAAQPMAEQTEATVFGKQDSSLAEHEQNDPTGATEDKAQQGEASDREKQISMLAYQKAQVRDFAPGGELQDWVEAEQEYEQLERQRESTLAS